MARSQDSSLESISMFEIAVMKPTTSDQSKAPPISVTSAIRLRSVICAFGTETLSLHKSWHHIS